MANREEMEKGAKVRRIRSESRMTVMQVGGVELEETAGIPELGERSHLLPGASLLTSERPWVSDIYVIKDSFADHARKEKVIKPRENFGCAWSTAGAAARWGDWYFPIVGG